MVGSRNPGSSEIRPTLEVVYEEARVLVAALRKEGRADAAEALDLSLYGATSGEALDIMAVALRKLLKSKEPLTPGSREKAVLLKKRVDTLLRR